MNARVLALAALCAAPAAPTATLAAQKADFRWEKALARGATVSLHNLNGGITVTPSTSGKVEIVGVKRGRSRSYEEVTIEVVETARGIVACSMFKDADMECGENGFRVHRDRGWGRHDSDWDDVQIDMEVKLPRELLLDAHAVSGDVSVVGAEGDVRVGSVSGDVRVERLRASSVRASSVSGNVTVGVEALTGTGDLKFTSVSGNVTAELPAGIDADVSMRSVSGTLDSDFPLTLNGRMSRNRVEARIGKGGRALEVSTVSGDVRLRSAK